MTYRKINLEDKNKIYQMYLDGEPGTKISKRIKINIKTVYSILNKLGIKIKSPEESKRKYKFDSSYFDKIDCYEKAYWLGFIAGDGGVVGNALIFNLSASDQHLLEKFKRDIKSEHKIKSYRDGFVTFTIRSKKLVESLKELNIGPNKSKTLSLSSKVPDQYLNAYLLGLFDADGCFNVDRKRGIRFCLIGSTVSMQQVQNILIEKCGVNSNKLLKHPTDGISNIQYFGRHQVKKIVDYLYADNKFCLARKKEIAYKFFNLI